MKKAKLSIGALAAALLFPCSAFAQESGLSAQQILVVAKYSGGCGIINQMASFQATTQMKGGDEFLTRFINTEAARLGTTPEVYMQRCQQAISTYNNFYQATEGK